MPALHSLQQFFNGDQQTHLVCWTYKYFARVIGCSVVTAEQGSVCVKLTMAVCESASHSKPSLFRTPKMACPGSTQQQFYTSSQG